MKKVAIVALLAVGGFALASSLNVPWFVDPAPAGAGLNSPNIVAVIALHNNLDEDVTCWIDYYAADGTYLNYTDKDGNGPYPAWELTDREYVWSPDYYTFVIAANSTVSFRPVAYDPGGSCVLEPQASDADPNGQESDAGVVIPNRPMYGSADLEGVLPNWKQTNKKNGACVVGWEGAATDIQGRYGEYAAGTVGFYLLPPGA